MDKEEILKEIKETKERLTNVEKMLEDCECERWKPNPNEEYYYVNQISATSRAVNDEFDIDAARYRTYNCFRTEEEAKQEAEKILVRRQLEDIARRLNKGNKIDWNNGKQFKYYICIDSCDNEIIWGREIQYISQGVVYCLDMDFCNVAIKEIGEERLIKYLRSE